jgi:hypothetical protein
MFDVVGGVADADPKTVVETCRQQAPGAFPKQGSEHQKYPKLTTH